MSGEHSLLENTLSRLTAFEAKAPIMCIAAADMGANARRALDHAGPGGMLVLEPEPRNTAPAIAAASYIAHAHDSDAVLVVLPADHVMEDREAFVAAAEKAATAATLGRIVILGVRPKEASADFGYIVPDHPVLEAVQHVGCFVEKPDPARAEKLRASGALWNAGIVVARADTVIAALTLHEPRVSAAVGRAVDRAARVDGAILLDRAAFAEAPSISFDRAVLERHGDVLVAALEVGWHDVGTWTEVAALMAADSDGNRISGDVRLVGSRGNFLFSPGRLTVGLGLEDLLVVNTPDALLISHKSRLGLLGDTVKAMIAEARPEALAGGFAETAANTRRVTLQRGQSLHDLLNLHHDAHWIVVAGEATLYCGEEITTLAPDRSRFIAAGKTHRIENTGPGRLDIIELLVARSNGGGGG